MADNSKVLTPDSDSPSESNTQTSNSSELNESADDRPTSQTKSEPTIKRKRFLQRQMANLEKELTFDQISKTLAFRFSPVDERQDKKPKESETDSRKNFLSSSMASIFIVGVTTGVALQRLPFALMESSWFGVFIIILFCLNSLYAGLCIGWSWVIMEEQWPHYLNHTRIPYQELGYRAVGTWMKYFIEISLNITLLSTGAVYLIMIAESVEIIAYRHIDFCPMLIIASAILMPFLLFSSYRNMKFIAVFDVMASLLYCVLVIISLFLDKPNHGRTVYTNPSHESTALSFASISFAYGSGANYPAILADMNDRSEYPLASGTAWLIILVLYSLMPILGYAAYGDLTPENIMQYTLMNSKLYELGVTVEIIYILQIASTFIIAMMPVVLSIEERLNCPDRFCLYRIIIRVFIMVILLLGILGLPFFPKFADFVGATFLNLLSFVFPPIFYVCLVYKRNTRHSKWKVNKKEILLLIEMLLLAILIGIISTNESLKAYMASPTNRASCYLNFSVSYEEQLG